MAVLEFSFSLLPSFPPSLLPSFPSLPSNPVQWAGPSAAAQGSSRVCVCIPIATGKTAALSIDANSRAGLGAFAVAAASSHPGAGRTFLIISKKASWWKDVERIPATRPTNHRLTPKSAGFQEQREHRHSEREERHSLGYI
ncbi:unnamed protein product [Pleuronectes platessa]|uniref:Uncharacterized protein n=1 Tax=Pleuronectes platessa TaxID=8262 RepID=A0A9N7TLI3_PLEPL|nr:unnamed protein product [Pleuronectes platessa]